MRDNILFVADEGSDDNSPEDLFVRTYPVSDLLPPVDLNGGIHCAYYESLLMLSETIISMTNANSNKVTPVAASACLVIKQTPERHDEILNLLRSLRAARKIAMAKAGTEVQRK